MRAEDIAKCSTLPARSADETPSSARSWMENGREKKDLEWLGIAGECAPSFDRPEVESRFACCSQARIGKRMGRISRKIPVLGSRQTSKRRSNINALV